MSQGRFRALVVVEPREGIADPEGRAITDAARHLALAPGVRVQAGRAFVVEVDAADPEEARRHVEAVADRLLANPVIQSWRVLAVEGASS